MSAGNFWFTTQTALPSFSATLTSPNLSVSHDPSRKQFFGKLLSLCAVAGVMPKLLAKSPATRAEAVPANDPAFLIRTDVRAISRRADSL